MRPFEKGFTLMELVIAIAVVTIAAFAVVGPSLDQYYRYKLKSGVESIQSALQLGKMMAIKNGLPVAAQFVGGSCTVFFDNGPTGSNAGDGIYQPGDGERLIKIGRIPKRVGVEAIAFSGGLNHGSSTLFNRHGYPMGTTGLFYTGSCTLRVKLPKKATETFYAKTITLGAGGNITISDGFYLEKSIP